MPAGAACYEEKAAATTYYKDKTVDDKVKRERFLHFSLQDALPAGFVLVLDTRLGILSYLRFNEEGPQMLMQQQFTGNEVNMLMHLLESFPYYCPYEVLYASFYNGEVTEAVVDRCRQHLQIALEDGEWAKETRQVRRAVSRIRLKLQTFGFNISSILETGYLLRVGAVRKGVEESVRR